VSRRRCLWCHRAHGRLIELPSARGGQAVFVHAEHEAALRAYLVDSERAAPRLLAVLAAALLVAIPALLLGTALGEAARTLVAAGIVLLAGALAWRYPLAAPPLMRAVGARKARSIVRVLAAGALAVGVLLAAAALGI
jgi:hypothetical protein